MGRIIASRWADETEPTFIFQSSVAPQADGPPLIKLSSLHRRCATPNSLRLCVPKKTFHTSALLSLIIYQLSLVIYLFSLIIHLLSSQSICFPHNPFAFPVGDKLLIGHGWHAWRPQGDMTCLPCLRSRRMVELCRSSTPYRNQQRIPLTTSRKAVELLQSSYTFDASTRQGSRFAPTLPYQAFNPFGVGELWRDGWHGENSTCHAEKGVLHAGVLGAHRDAERLEFCIFDAERRAWVIRGPTA